MAKTPSEISRDITPNLTPASGPNQVAAPENILQLDIKAILKARIPPKYARWMPPFLIRGLENLIRQKELNEILRATLPSEGSEFSGRVLDFLDIKLDVVGLDNLKEGARYMFASNHPLGGLDGMALITVLGKKYGDDNIRFLVNDMLMNVSPLKNLFLPINKFGRQGRENARIINDTMASECQVLQFPAGLCSRLNSNGEIADLEWQKSFVVKALESHRDIVPVFFQGCNSPKFYRIAKWRKKLGVKFNFEQILLPSELCKARGSRFRIIFGKPVACSDLSSLGSSPTEIASAIRRLSYSLPQS